VSAAYYALFHLLAHAAATIVAPNVGEEVNHRIQRWLDHSEMKRICGRFLATQFTQPLLDLIGRSASVDMQLVARTFVQLQDARHSADYDLSWSVTRGEALQFIAAVQEAFGRVGSPGAKRRSEHLSAFAADVENWERERP